LDQGQRRRSGSPLPSTNLCLVFRSNHQDPAWSLDRLNQHCDAGHCLAALQVVTTWEGNASNRLTSASFPMLRWRFAGAFAYGAKRMVDGGFIQE